MGDPGRPHRRRRDARARPARARRSRRPAGDPGPLRRLTTYFPHNGTSDATFHLFAADAAEHVGDPHDTDEAERVEWVPWAEVVGRDRTPARSATACRSPRCCGCWPWPNAPDVKPSASVKFLGRDTKPSVSMAASSTTWPSVPHVLNPEQLAHPGRERGLDVGGQPEERVLLLADPGPAEVVQQHVAAVVGSVGAGLVPRAALDDHRRAGCGDGADRPHVGRVVLLQRVVPQVAAGNGTRVPPLTSSTSSSIQTTLVTIG